MGLRNGFEIFHKEITTSINKTINQERKTAGIFITHYAEIDLFYPRSDITASLDGAPRERSSRKVHAFERMSDRLAAPASLT